MAPVLREQPQSALEEVADLAEAPADAGLLLNDGPRLLGRADRVLQKVLLQRVLVLGQGAVGVMPPAAAQVRQAALIILVEVALDGAPGDVGVGGDLVVSQAVALEPEDLHLALDAGVGVVVTVVGQGVPVVRREGDDPQDGSTLMLSPGCSPSAVYTHTLPPTIRARPGRAEYNAIKGLLAGLGLQASVDADFPQRLKKLRQWDGSAVPTALSQRLLREFERWQLVGRQIHELEQERIRQIRKEQSPEVEQVRRLLNLQGIGENGAWLLVGELFSWRRFQNRRELGSLAGLTPTPYDSGESRREQGISKAGNRRVRWMMVQLAWGWLQYQPESELSQWYQRRFGNGNSRLRKIGIVALARKLLIALWKYLETGEPPAGAEVIGWDKKAKFTGASRRGEHRDSKREQVKRALGLVSPQPERR